MQVFVVAMEYRGDTLESEVAAPRVPVREHAYGLETATLAGHPDQELPRLGFPGRQRGWNSHPETTRCPDCDCAMQRIVRAVISAAIAAGMPTWRPGPWM